MGRYTTGNELSKGLEGASAHKQNLRPRQPKSTIAANAKGKELPTA